MKFSIPPLSEHEEKENEVNDCPWISDHLRANANGAGQTPSPEQNPGSTTQSALVQGAGCPVLSKPVPMGSLSSA